MTYQSAQNLNVIGSFVGFFVTSAGSGEADMTVCGVLWLLQDSMFRNGELGSLAVSCWLGKVSAA